MREPTRCDLDLFQRAIADRFGLLFDDGKADLMAEILKDRLVIVKQDEPQDYLRRLAAPAGWPDEWRALAERLTVTETYFFRYADQFQAFSDVALPHALRRRPASEEAVVLSAGCASGEEAYTMALLAEGRPVRIIGIDVNPAAIGRARRGRYTSWSLRETPADVLARWFRAEGREFVLDEAARGTVRFEERNLLDDDPGFWKPDAFDVIFCRNVLMYFNAAAARAVVARLWRSLRAGGHLFLGHAETLRGLSDAFHLCHSHDTFYYRKRDTADRRERPAVRADSPVAAWSAAPWDATWVDTIRRASERIASLSKSGGPPAPETAARTWDLGAARELLSRERFSEALEAIGGLPPESMGDGEVLLLRAAILTNSGGVEEAEKACRRLLAADELNAGAHYLLALCREQAGDLPGAVEEDKTAAYLDASFAMPRLHLGLLARRGGDSGRAAAELTAALELLEREEGSRILLFGGGFSRDALTTLCRTELAACGGGR